MTGVRPVLSPFQLVNSHGDRIFGDLRHPNGEGKAPLLIVCHSFMAFKEWGFFPYSAQWLAQQGFAVITFNFSLNGVDGNSNRITLFDKFARNTFTRELEDLACVVDAVVAGELGNDVCDTARIGILGHSRGGGIAIVYAANDERIKALTTWSAISTFDRWSHHQKSLWRQNGFLPLAKDSAVSPLKLGPDILQDVEGHRDALDIRAAAGSIDALWLILHGREDVTVKSHEAEILFEASVKHRTKLVILDHVNHLYNAANEEEDHYATLHAILAMTSDWFHEHLIQE